MGNLDQETVSVSVKGYLLLELYAFFQGFELPFFFSLFEID